MNMATGSHGNRRFELRAPDNTTAAARRTQPVWSMYLYDHSKNVSTTHNGYFLDMYMEATKFLQPTYSHTYTISFSVHHSTDETGEDVTPEDLRAALELRIKGLDNSHNKQEWAEAVGMPTDTYEEH